MQLQLHHIAKSFSEQAVLQALSMGLQKGAILSLLGPSGCGKSTLLKVIAGLLRPDAGSIFLGHKRIDHLPANQRGVVYLFQEALLFPHLSVYHNIAYGLEIRKYRKHEISQKVNHFLERMSLDGLAGRRPEELSGGQKQRVAFARALIIEPELVLLDEPFASLDSSLRKQMQTFLKELLEEQGNTALFVTHDVREALVMGSRYARMESGQLITYPHREAFIEDPATGIRDEILFWEGQKTPSLSPEKPHA